MSIRKYLPRNDLARRGVSRIVLGIRFSPSPKHVPLRACVTTEGGVSLRNSSGTTTRFKVTTHEPHYR